MLSNKDFFNNIVMSMVEMLIVIHPDGKIRMANQSACNRLGYKEEELIGRHISMLCGEEEGEFSMEEINAIAFQGGRNVERKYKAKDGAILPVSCSCSVMFDGLQSITGMTFVAQDISERKQMEEKLLEYKNKLQDLVEIRTKELFDTTIRLKMEIAERRQAEEKYRDLFENAVDPIFIVGADMKYKDVNKRAIELFGYTKEEFLDMGIFDVIPPEQVPRSESEVEKLKKQGAYEKFIGKMRKKDGSYIDIEVSSSAIIENGTVVGSRDIVRDITERKQAEHKERMAELGAVAAKIAHDLRNPLVSIGGFAKRLKTKLSGPMEEQAGIILKETRRLESNLREILGFVREGNLQKKELDICSILEEIALLYQDELSERKIELTKKLEDPLMVRADSYHLKEALINVLTNAMQAVGADGRIGLVAGRNGVQVEIILSDSGPGINEKDLQQIFKPFFTTKVFGSGLGLTITRKIIQEHGGTIEAQTKLNSGTAFTIRLPAAT